MRALLYAYLLLPLLHTGGCSWSLLRVYARARVYVRIYVFLPTYACLEKPVSWRPSSRFQTNACFS